MSRRILSLWLPRLATDARERGAPAETRRLPLVLLRTERRRRMVVAVNPPAAAAGLRPGQTLADARALEPGLEAAEATPEADAALLDRIAGWARRYSPWTAADGPDGVVIDITGCAHLFGGEPELAADLTGRLRAAGFAARAAVAATPAAAWGLARFGTAEDLRHERLDGLPMAALRLPAETLEALHAVGLRRVGDLHAMPRAGLAARYGTRLLQRYDQAFGRLDEPISPRLPVPAHRERLAFAEPIATPESIAGALRHLLGRLCAGLEAAGHGARRLRLEAHRTDQRLEDEPQSLALGTSRPARDPAMLARLFAPLLERIEPGPGLETLTLSATETAPLAPVQTGIDGEDPDDGLAELVDRLVLRLGERAVLRLVPRESWLPERSVAPARPLDRLSGPAVPPAWPADRLRPLRLLTPPEPVDATAPVPDDPPLQFLWRGVRHRVLRAEGPERVECEWWRPEGSLGWATRDYYRIEDGDGRRFWLFRAGLYRPDETPRWFLHGLLG
ncbi:Y-family DNA polymerase [Azospirillum picis]|uniref:DNA-directed DNA polymerase n=1 Tax=Azospirillum picis TaxID=488438 RepID=A0ABU0MQ03_9PROT|nr:DNA polymerase Y family protein [Azospirillum picis]MBP2301457.1 protein ImuB [Azospirillum picis]MDQ0535289.1 protein ImuB [Azospirillum picis]